MEQGELEEGVRGVSLAFDRQRRDRGSGTAMPQLRGEGDQKGSSDRRDLPAAGGAGIRRAPLRSGGRVGPFTAALGLGAAFVRAGFRGSGGKGRTHQIREQQRERQHSRAEAVEDDAMEFAVQALSKTLPLREPPVVKRAAWPTLPLSGTPTRQWFPPRGAARSATTPWRAIRSRSGSDPGPLPAAPHRV